MPGLPGVPSSPGFPGAPGSPIRPRRPGAPAVDIPGGPGRPSSPVSPGAPFWPGKPGNPGRPGYPAVPLSPLGAKPTASPRKNWFSEFICCPRRCELFPPRCISTWQAGVASISSYTLPSWPARETVDTTSSRSSSVTLAKDTIKVA